MNYKMIKRLLKTYWNYPIVKMLQNMHTRFALPHLISIAMPKKGIYESINQQLNCRLLKSQLIHWVIAGLILSDLTDNFTWIEDITMDIVFQYIPYGLISDRFPMNVSLLLHTLHRLRMCARVWILRTVRSVQE